MARQRPRRLLCSMAHSSPGPGSPASGQRICLVHWAFPPTAGGVESHLWDLAHGLAAAGASVTVLVGEENPLRSQVFEVVSTPLLNLNAIRASPRDRGEYMAGLRHRLGSVLRTRQVDVVHGHNLHQFRPEPGLVLDELRAELRFKLHHTFHGMWPGVLHDAPVYRRWEGSHAVSAYVQRECERRLGFRPGLLRPGIDAERFRPTRPVFSSGGPPTLLHPARMLPWKGVHLSVRLAARLRSQGVPVRLLLTDAPLIADWNHELDLNRAALLEQVRALDLTDVVELRSTAYAAMPSLYGEADVVLYPTTGEEPYGLVPLEAMSCCRPVVASDVGGLRETVVDEETGFLVSPGDLEALVERVGRLLSSGDLAVRMGEAGRAHVVRHFRIDQYVSRLLTLYRGDW